MKKSTNYGFNLPESTDFYDVGHTNSNFEAVDRELKALADSTETKASQTAVDAIQTTSKATLSQAGWYRVAEYNASGTSSAVQGSRSNSCLIGIKTKGTGSLSCTGNIRLISRYNGGQKFVLEFSNNVATYFPRIRYTCTSSSPYCAYIEVYCECSASTVVDAHFTVLEGEDTDYAWKAITPTLTSETVDGVTVTTTCDIPSNASPVTDLDLDLRTLAQLLPTGTDLNTCTETCIYFCKDYATNYVNTPNENAHNGFLFVTKYEYGATIRITQRYVSCNFNTAYERSSVGGDEWKPWKTTATTADLANYFKNTGGAINGNVTIGNSTDATQRVLFLENTARKISHEIYSDGAYYLKDRTNGKDIIKSTADGTNTFNGTASGNLPLSGGGTVKGVSSAHPLTLDTDKDYILLKYLIGGNLAGYLGFIGVDTPVFTTSSGSSKKLLHEGNSAKVLVQSTPLTEAGSIRVW